MSDEDAYPYAYILLTNHRSPWWRSICHYNLALVLRNFIFSLYFAAGIILLNRKLKRGTQPETRPEAFNLSYVVILTILFIIDFKHGNCIYIH